MKNFVRPEHIASPRQIADLFMDRLEEIGQLDIPHEKVGIAHITCGLIYKEDPPQVFKLLDEKRMRSIFDVFAKKGDGVNQIYNNIINNQLFDAYILLSPAKVNGEVADVFGLAKVLLLDALVVGGDDTAVNTQLCERLGQCADNVSQTTGLGQRSAFGGCNQNLRHFAAALFFQSNIMFTNHVNISFPMIVFSFCNGYVFCITEKEVFIFY